MPILLDLFLTFFKIGIFTFGGGYAMIPIIEDEVLSHGWMAKAEISNFIAVSECTPGPIAINMATFVGASQSGFLGALMATLGVVLPSLIIILLIASILKNFLSYKGVKGFLFGVRPIVIGLITATGLTMLLSVVLSLDKLSEPIAFDWKALVILAIITTVYLVYKKLTKKYPSAIILIIISAVLGMIFYGLIP